MKTGLAKVRAKMKELYKSKLRELQQGKATYWDAQEGNHEIRICPSWAGAKGLFYKEVPTHYGLGPDHKLSGTCSGEQCLACKKAAKLSSSSFVKKQKRGERLMVKTRIAMNIVDLSNPEKVVIWTTAPTNLQELLILAGDADYEDFYSPKHGYNIKVSRTGKRLATKWKLRPVKNSSKLRGWKKILKPQLFNLDKRFRPLEASKMAALLRGENIYEKRKDDE